MKQKSTLFLAKMLLGWCLLAILPSVSLLASPAENAAMTDSENAMRITGRVTDEAGEALPGVSIRVKGSSAGTVSDATGNYAIEAAPGATLVFSYTGFETKEVAVGSSATLDVQLTSNADVLSDVVVIGYGTVKKSDLTASVASIKAEDIKAYTVTSVDQALTARATGVNVTQASGAPGGGVTVRVRGPNSISSGAEPLYVVDGLPIYSDNDAYSAGGNRVSSNALASINPNDIESVEVLKDASGTAIYGSRGSNGVVLITTKRGKAGVTKIDYEGSHGFQSVLRDIEMMNATEYAQYQNARARSRNQTEPYPNPGQFGEGVNWLDETTRTGGLFNHNLSFTGGSDKMIFAITGGYHRNDGIIQNTDFSRYSIRANIETKFWDNRLRLGTTSQVARTIANAIPTDRGGPGGAIITILGQSPIGPVYKTDGTYNLDSYDGRFLTNPVAEVNEVIDNDKGTRYLGNNYLSLDILKNLTFRTSFGLDLFNSNRETWYSRQTRLGRERNRSYELAQRNITNFLNENTLNYSREIGQGRLDLLGGYSYQTDANRLFGAQSNDFVTDDLEVNRIGNGVKPQLPYSSRADWVLKSFFGRVNYSLMDKYLFTVNFRRDGSSRFGETNKWANFPSFAFGWRAKEESFLKDVDAISNLKVRLSYGITGNSQIPVGRSLAQLSGGTNYLVDETIVPGMAVTYIGNKDLRWETTKMFNAGVDFGILNDKVNFTLDYFRNETSDLILEVVTPFSTGFRSVFKNSGTLQNSGIELGINTVAINTRDLRLDVGVNLSTLKNEVKSLGGTAPFYSYVVSHLGPEGSYIAEGAPIGGWYGFNAIGIWQTQEEINANPSLTGIDKPGYVRYEDVNGDGTISNADRKILGDPNPDFVWGFNTRLTFKGLDFNLFLRGAHGHQIRNLQASEHADGVGNYNQFRSVATDSWSTSNTSGTRPVIDATREFPSYFRRSNFFIEDGDFVRLQNVSIGYTLPKISHVRSLRVYVSGQNLALWTKYTGFDPEVSNGGQSPLNRGDDYDAYPRAKVVTLGVQLGL